MTIIEQLEEEVHALDLRVTRLEEDVRVLQGHAPDPVIADSFEELWMWRGHPHHRPDVAILRGLYQHILERWAPDGLDAACAWLSGASPDPGGKRPIDLIRDDRLTVLDAALVALV